MTVLAAAPLPGFHFVFTDALDKVAHWYQSSNPSHILPSVCLASFQELWPLCSLKGQFGEFVAINSL